MKLAVTILAVALALGACGDDGGDEAGADAGTEPTTVTTVSAGESAASAGEAVVGVINQQIAGQFGPMYDSLHPEQQALIPRDQFMLCAAQKQRENPLTVTDDLTIEPVDSYADEVPIPGTDSQVAATAITVEISAQGESARHTMHAVDVDGTWRWIVPDPAEYTSC